MKKFLYNILSFAIVILLVTVLIEFLLFLRPNLYSYKREYVETHINDITCLLLGNSHIEEALNPGLMGRGVFNMAISGRAPIYDIELAKRYVPDMKHLEALVIPLDYTRFSLGRGMGNPNEKKRPDGMESTYKCMYYKYMGIHVDEWWYWSEFINSKLNFMKRFTMNDEDARECDSLGYVPLELEKRVANWKYRALPNIIDTAKEIDKEKYDLLCEQYRLLARLTAERNARLVLLGTPMYKTYHEGMNEKVVGEIKAFVAMLRKEFPHVEYYDYSFDKRFGEDDFNDASHLTVNGAVKFSNMIKEEVLGRVPYVPKKQE